jgi:hypothetical protein
LSSYRGCHTRGCLIYYTERPPITKKICLKSLRENAGCSYVNRFGPGMVIYWFGYTDEVNDNPDILLMDHFLDTSEDYCLTVLPVQARP